MMGEIQKNREKRPLVGRAILKRFAKDRRGSTAVEFTLLAVPFLALVFAIIESSVSFGAHQVTANAVEDLARDLRTRTISQAAATPAEVRNYICNRIDILVPSGCPDLYVDLQVYADYGAVPLTIPMAGNDLDTSGFKIEPGGDNEINQLRVFYKWRYYTDFIGSRLAPLPDNKTLIYATTTWRNEPPGGGSGT
jgi:Flp pilus assembly protein TadG